jgi:predicted AAA+ superfamily ATPase
MFLKKKKGVTMGALLAQSATEELFIDIFTELFGADKSDYLCLQQPFYDIYGNQRYIDFALEEGARKIAIEVDGESVHNPTMILRDKYYDDLLKQNSLICEGWQVYR